MAPLSGSATDTQPFVISLFHTFRTLAVKYSQFPFSCMRLAKCYGAVLLPILPQHFI